jgi:hypothetical protein
MVLSGVATINLGKQSASLRQRKKKHSITNILMILLVYRFTFASNHYYLQRYRQRLEVNTVS